MTTIHVYGDSHARYFFPKQLGYQRAGIDSRVVNFAGSVVTAASVAGFRKVRPTLETRQRILTNIDCATHMILAFGQVDLELGYYYRLVVKRERITPRGYVDWLAGTYFDFLATLPLGHLRLALKGVNLTLLDPVELAVDYISQIVTEGGSGQDRRAFAEGLADHILGEAAQNAMHLDFNRRLKAGAEARGHRYFDVNEPISAPDPVTGLCSVDPRFRPAEPDHHLADTLYLRSLHMRAAIEVFGIDPATCRISR